MPCWTAELIIAHHRRACSIHTTSKKAVASDCLLSGQRASAVALDWPRQVVGTCQTHRYSRSICVWMTGLLIWLPSQYVTAILTLAPDGPRTQSSPAWCSTATAHENQSDGGGETCRT